MFHSSTTLWQKNDHSNPLNPMGNRPVFKVNESVVNFFSKISGFGGGVYDTANYLTAPFVGPIKFLLLPITAPTQIALWSLKTGYKWVAKPVFKAGMVGTGTAWEMASGIKDAIVNPALTLAKAPLVNLKMSLWDFPTYLVKSAVRLPGEILKTPGRFLSEAKKMFMEFPGKVANVYKTTRDNVAKVLENMATPSELIIPNPIEIAKSIGKATRDLVKGALVDPMKDSFNLLWNPVAPLVALPAGAAGIVLNSKWQYATSMVKAAGEARTGVKRVIDAPGKKLDTHGAKKWWNEVFPPKVEEPTDPTKDGKLGDKPLKPAKPDKPPKPPKPEKGGDEHP